MRALVGDVGATHARLAVAELSDDDYRLERRREYRSGAYDGLAPIVRDYLDGLEERPERASLGVAAPVVGGRCRFPNLDWTLERSVLAAEIGIPDTRLLNDFSALCHSLPLLGPDDTVELQAGEPVSGAARAVIGAGTGLGQGFATGEGAGYRVHASEGGHADFAPRDEVEWELRAFLAERHGHVSYERVVSGPGLVNLYDFLVQSGRGEERRETRDEMEEKDPAAVISRRGLDGSDPTCRRALDRFIGIYGAQTGNLALTVEALGGVFVAGGIAPKILDPLREGDFLEAFRAKGRFRSHMATIPVRVIVQPYAGLVGAARAARQR